MSNARNLSDLLGTGTTIATASIADDAITAAKVADGVFNANKNLVINGAMQVSARGDVTGITGADVYGGADRFPTNGGGYGTVSLVQEADAPEGFAKSQRVKFTTARSTTATSDHFVIGTRLEGQDLQRFKKGTSNAESMTVSFYAKASQATSITLELFDSDNSRHAGKKFDITTSWARYSYTFAGDTTGAFNNDNGLSLYVFFWLGAGTNFTSGTNPDGSWIANDATRRVHSDVGTTFMDTLNAEFNLTGVQLEVGQLTPFEHRSYGEEERLCKRYYNQWSDGTQTYTSLGIGTMYSNTYLQGGFELDVPMRAKPSLVQENSTDVYGCSIAGAFPRFDTFSGLDASTSPSSVMLYRNQSISSTQGASGIIMAVSATLALDAEL